MEPGDHRDAALVDALMQNGALLDDELYAEWALVPREALELLRQRARLSSLATGARDWPVAA